VRILFASLLSGLSASGRQRREALESLGHEVSTFSFDGYDRALRGERKLRRVLRAPYFRADDLQQVGRDFVAAVQRAKADVAWVEKPLMVLPRFLAEARAVSTSSVFCCFQDDDPFGRRQWERPAWKHFVEAIPLYDVHFVKRVENVQEFRARAARRVELFMHGVHTPMFYPRSHTPDGVRRAVTFVGTPLDHRVAYIEYLLRRGLPLEVYGNRWKRSLVYWRFRAHFHPAIVGERYASLLSGSKICLGFVSSSNRDQYSMRTFEIPGCGSMLLAERTPVHQALFTEGMEAEFFESADECASKCHFYLRNDVARERIARAGRARCVRSDYSLERRMREALASLDL
jgi:spore maturation protein CgeB